MSAGRSAEEYQARYGYCDGAGFAAGVGDRGDEPLAVLADEVEEIGAAVVDFAVAEKFEGRPDDGEVVVDANERIVDALFDLCGSGVGEVRGEVVEGHADGLAVAHQDQGAAGEQRRADGGGVAMGHAVEQGLHGRENGLFFRSGGVGGERDEDAEQENETEAWVGFEHSKEDKGTKRGQNRAVRFL